ncbi:MAG: CHAP domain-containing protein [Clostridiales bacterium]|jgi:hypothetical protein|nr:CHAP domain-containing protein [Clostridiales bacterium]
MRTIKTRETTKSIKVLDKTIKLSRRVKSPFDSPKESTEKTQGPHETSPTDYAINSIQGKAQEVARGAMYHFPGSLKNISENIQRSNIHFQEVKRLLPQERKRIAEQAQKTAQRTRDIASQMGEAADKAQKAADNAKATTRPNYLSKGVNASKSTASTAKAADKSTRNIKTASRGFKDTSKGMIKTANKSIKTSEQTARAAHKTARAAAKSARAAEKTARAAAKTAVRTAKIAKKTVTALLKASIAAIKGLVAAIAAGGWVAVIIVLVICMIGLMSSSIFGIFFSREPDPVSGLTINSVIAAIDKEYTDKTEALIADNTHDLLDMSGARAAWKQVLAVYTVKTVSDPGNPMEVATMNSEKADILLSVFWDMNAIVYNLDTVNVNEDVFDSDGLPTGETITNTKTVLRINVSHKTVEEMTVQYCFNSQQREWLEELLKPEHHPLWNALLYGITSIGNASMIEIAEIQLGNIGGEPFWSWYGFTSRQPWCGCYVSWVADQCGFIEAGVIPMFAWCDDGVDWFKEKGQWQDSSYTPMPGDIVFFDWDGDRSANHVGIVEFVDGDFIYTIEGNANDSCARRSYRLDSEKVLGYGTPAYQ